MIRVTMDKTRKSKNLFFSPHKKVQGLCVGEGIELRAQAHNPFYLNGSRNVDWGDDFEFRKDHQLQLCGAYAEIDVQAHPYDLTDHFEDSSLDYILSSHVLQDIPDLFRVLYQAEVVLKDGGILFCILPLPDALDTDAGRPLTTFEDLYILYFNQLHNVEAPYPPVPRHVFNLASFTEIVLKENPHWALEFSEERDSKVGNGFTAVFRVHKRPVTNVPDSTIHVVDVNGELVEVPKVGESVVETIQREREEYLQLLQSADEDVLRIGAIDAGVPWAGSDTVSRQSIISALMELYDKKHTMNAPQGEYNPFDDPNVEPVAVSMLKAALDLPTVPDVLPSTTGTLTVGDVTLPSQDVTIEPPTDPAPSTPPAPPTPQRKPRKKKAQQP